MSTVDYGATVEQLVGFWEYSQPMDIDPIVNEPLIEMGQSHYRRSERRISDKSNLRQRLPEVYRDLRKIVKQYSWSPKHAAGERHKMTRADLANFIARTDQELRTNGITVESLAAHSCWRSTVGEWFNGLNAQLMAQSILALLNRPGKKSAPNSVEAAWFDLMRLTHMFPNQLLFTVTEDALVTALKDPQLHLCDASIHRLFVMLRGYRAAIKQTYKNATWVVNLPIIDWRKVFRLQAPIHTQRLLLQRDVYAILQALYRMNRKYSEHCMVAVLLGYYFGLRISEITSLKAGHLQSDGVPTVYVIHGKGAFFREVDGVEIPESVIRFLSVFKDRRAADGNSAFLFPQQGGRMRRQLTDLLQTVLDRRNIHISTGEKKAGFHILRKATANRWLALGISPQDISYLLGLHSIDITGQVYLNAFHFLKPYEAF